MNFGLVLFMHAGIAINTTIYHSEYYFVHTEKNTVYYSSWTTLNEIISGHITQLHSR